MIATNVMNNLDLDQKRKTEESFKDYKERLKSNAWHLKIYKKGSIFWDSIREGTLIKKEGANE